MPEPVDADVVARTVFCGMPCLVDAGFGHCGLIGCRVGFTRFCLAFW